MSEVGTCFSALMPSCLERKRERDAKRWSKGRQTGAVIGKVSLAVQDANIQSLGSQSPFCVVQRAKVAGRCTGQRPPLSLCARWRRSCLVVIEFCVGLSARRVPTFQGTSSREGSGSRRVVFAFRERSS